MSHFRRSVKNMNENVIFPIGNSVMPDIIKKDYGYLWVQDMWKDRTSYFFMTLQKIKKLKKKELSDQCCCYTHYSRLDNYRNCDYYTCHFKCYCNISFLEFCEFIDPLGQFIENIQCKIYCYYCKHYAKYKLNNAYNDYRYT